MCQRLQGCLQENGLRVKFAFLLNKFKLLSYAKGFYLSEHRSAWDGGNILSTKLFIYSRALGARGGFLLLLGLCKGKKKPPRARAMEGAVPHPPKKPLLQQPGGF